MVLRETFDSTERQKEVNMEVPKIIANAKAHYTIVKSIYGIVRGRVKINSKCGKILYKEKNVTGRSPLLSASQYTSRENEKEYEEDETTRNMCEI